MCRSKRKVAPPKSCLPERPEPKMTVPRSVGEVLANHVSLEVECVDRM